MAMVLTRSSMDFMGLCLHLGGSPHPFQRTMRALFWLSQSFIFAFSCLSCSGSTRCIFSFCYFRILEFQGHCELSWMTHTQRLMGWWYFFMC